MLSDIHAGRQNDRVRARTLRALEHIVEHANTREIAQIILNGDMLDERARWEHVQTDTATIRERLERFHAGLQNIRFVYGNHDFAADRKIADVDIQQLLGISRVESDWIVFDEAVGITYTHGHIFGTGYAKRSLLSMAREESGDVQILCASDAFQRKIDSLHRRYVAACSIGKWMGRLGIPVEPLWETLRSHTHILRLSTAEMLRQAGMPALQQAAKLLDLSSHTIAAELGTTLGGWCALVGHTHAPAVAKRFVRRGNTVLPQLVGNSGSFVSKAGFPVTFIEARYPSVTLWEYDAGNDALRERKTMTLTPQECDALTGAQ